MKKLFFITLFTFGLTTTIQAQCVAEYDYEDVSFHGLDKYLSFNGKAYRCVITTNNTSTPSASVYVDGIEYTVAFDYLYSMWDGALYHIYQLDADDESFEFVAIIGNAGDLREYEICKR